MKHRYDSDACCWYMTVLNTQCCRKDNSVVHIELSKDDIDAVAASSYTRRGSVQVSQTSPPCLLLRALWSGSIWLLLTKQSTPPTPNLCFWLRSLAILTASSGFTLSLCVAPPTNLPLSLLWESLVIAIGLSPAVAHLCEHGILCVRHRHTDSQVLCVYLK